MDSTQKLLQISLRFFLYVKVHNMYVKTVPGFVDIRFTSLPKLMKKIKSTPPPPPPPPKKKKKKKAFSIKYVEFGNLTHVSKNTGTVLGVAYIQTNSQNKNENQAFRLGVESRIVKKVFSPKTLKQYHMTKICCGKGCNGYLSIAVYNVSKSNFGHLQSRWKYSHLIRVLFYVSCTLKCAGNTYSVS